MREILKAAQVASTPVPAPIWWKAGDVGPQRRASDGAMALSLLGQVTAKRDVPVYQSVSSGIVVARIAAGETARIVGTYRAGPASRRRWNFVEVAPGQYGRALWSAFVERFPTL